MPVTQGWTSSAFSLTPPGVSSSAPSTQPMAGKPLGALLSWPLGVAREPRQSNWASVVGARKEWLAFSQRELAFAKELVRVVVVVFPDTRVHDKWLSSLLQNGSLQNDLS